MTDHKHKEIIWGIWAILLLNGAYHSKGAWVVFMFIVGLINWAMMLYHGRKADRDE